MQQNDRAQIIKDRLTMPEVLRHYGYEPKKRMKCPLHHGEDNNFTVLKNGYRCFSHCGGGDVITFVQKLFGLSFGEALRKIDNDFRLGLYNNRDIAETIRNDWKAKELKARQDRLAFEKKQVEDEYWKTFSEWKRLDDNKRLYAPKTPDEEWHPLFKEALQKIGYQEYLLDCAEAKLRGVKEN